MSLPPDEPPEDDDGHNWTEGKSDDEIADMYEWLEAAGMVGAHYVNEPLEWLTDRVGEAVWTKQAQILESVRDHKRTAVPSAHAVGKSFTAARAAAWWLDSHPPGSAMVVTSAPTFQQVRAILWREIRRCHAKGNLVGYVNQTEWHINGELVGFGRKPPDGDEDSFQGIHAQYVLVILDEASGVPESVWAGAEKVTTTSDCRILAIGNPDYEGSRFDQVCRSEAWHTITISAFDSPNFTDEPLPPGAPLVDADWVDGIKVQYGIDSPRYMAQVLGQFPSDRLDGVVPWSKISEARLRDLGDQSGEIVMGLDVAGPGEDETVAWIRQGDKALAKHVFRSPTPEGVLAEVKQAILKAGVTRLNYDSIGVGHFVSVGLDDLRGVSMTAVNVAEAASDKARWANKRAEVHWFVRENIGSWDLTGIDDVTAEQLAAAQWFEDTKGRVQIEKKDDIRKRIGGSPDSADALQLAFWVEPHAGSAMSGFWSMS